MMDPQAGIGLHQLARVEENWQCRRELWRRYDNGSTDLPITLPAPREADTRHGYHLIYGNDRSHSLRRRPRRFPRAMNAARIGTGVHCLSVPEHPHYQQHFGWRPKLMGPRHASGTASRQFAVVTSDERP